VLLGVYWFLLLSPKREEASKAGEALATAEQKRDEAVAKESQLSAARKSFASDYTELVRLGKAIPSSLDMPSLLVQLDAAARGTGIDFNKIATGTRQGASAPAPAPSGGGGQGQGGEGSKPTEAGGQEAQSAPGKATEKANETASQGGGGEKGGQPAGGGGAAALTPGICPEGLECVPLDFEFTGRFFDLADFFHRLKRFVQVANERVLVRGRLMTIDGLKFSSDGANFPDLKAEVKATIYLTPKEEGATAGATPQGPAAPAAGGAAAKTPTSATASTPSAPPTP
jgi:Tfp pilus assembly protein PilO